MHGKIGTCSPIRRTRCPLIRLEGLDESKPLAVSKQPHVVKPALAQDVQRPGRTWHDGPRLGAKERAQTDRLSGFDGYEPAP
jgi:hypothetical protein